MGEWAAFERQFGPLLIHERIDIIGAQVSAVLANLLSSGKRYEVTDFMPHWGGRGAKPEQSVEQMKSLMTALARGHEGRRRKRRISGSSP